MNKTLAIGLAITAILFAAALFGQWLAPYDLHHQLKIDYILDDSGKGYLIAPPSPPGSDYPLGTDKDGYDLLTKLLNGARYTVLLSIGIALARIFIGGSLGMFMGYYGKQTVKPASGSSSWNMLNGIPVFIISWFVLRGITTNSSLSPLSLSLLTGVVLTAVGIPSVVSSVKGKTQVIRDRQFVQAAQSLGAGHWKIVRSHLFPHLKENLLVLIVQEVILVLALFGQLGIFNIFVGGTTMYFDMLEYHSRTNEWGGLIAQWRDLKGIYPWIFYYPLAAYILLIMGLHFIAHGLEAMYKKRYAKFSHL
ncbi:ABC transporter permease subunit [Cohnella lubricantis]|uniref:ABC transporter permease n=1 Tax=Cohnella lubricantis TaxID=2163172 RepID=A0A841T5U1_9BACL|nr:ABC transporter permease subunit [Cohnella lubricantis]MBB6676903.1 ABC transporter permease [Cohnella lubricantis]MBP2118304.1 peptide/nickel transport system permease protein [Cohnella lubricantis]